MVGGSRTTESGFERTAREKGLSWKKRTDIPLYL